MDKTSVSYTIKDSKGFLVDVKQNFSSASLAIHFIRALNKLPGVTVVGKPVLEHISNKSVGHGG